MAPVQRCVSCGRAGHPDFAVNDYELVGLNDPSVDSWRDYLCLDCARQYRSGGGVLLYMVPRIRRGDA